MRNKLITLSYMFDGNIIKMENALKSNINVEINYKFINYLATRGIEVLTIVDEKYPKQFKQLYNPPLVIYCLGRTELLNSKMFAIIGSRKNKKYSEDVCKWLVSTLNNNVTVISGLAIGIDSLAHKYAIKHHLNTIAIIGSGFNKVYPFSNQELADNIANNYLLLSEYPPDVCAEKINFPLRNRLIASLCEKLYVIEAAIKSGSLITANIALELGKEIYCVPGNIFETNYQGSHQLINDGAYLLDIRNEENR